MVRAERHKAEGKRTSPTTAARGGATRTDTFSRPGNIGPPMTTPATRADMTAGSLATGALDLVRAHPVALLLPLGILGAIGGIGSGNAEPSPTEIMNALPFYALLGVVGLLLLVVLVVAYALAWGMTARSALRAAAGQRVPEFGAAIQDAKPQVLGILGTGLLVIVIVLVGLILLIVPGLIAIAGLIAWPAVLVAEGKTGLVNLGRSWELTDGHKGSLFLVVLGAAVAGIVGGLLVSWIPGIGGILAGAWDGVMGGYLATLGALFYHRRTHETPTPPIAATPAVLDA